MRARSLVVTDLSGTESHPRIFELAEEVRIVVGRNRECHVALDPRHRVVSARHAALRLEGARLKVRDLDSHNGTFVEIEGKGRRRLAKGEDALLGAQDAAFVGPYRLSLCEPVGHGVVLTDDSDSSGMNSTQTGAPSEAPPRAFASLPDSTTAAVSALTTAMSADAAVNSWEAVLGGLIELTRPHSAVLLRRREGRFVSRASMGLAPAVPLSRRFVELTAGRDRSWRFSPGDSGLGLLSSPSIVEIGEGVTLTGVPFPARNGETIAVACVEHQDAGHGLDLAALDLFATLAGAMLELGHGLDRETRRREALEHRLRRVRGERGEADAQGGRSALIGSSRAFRDAVELVERVADAEATLLIRGPTGAGKEQLARLAHEASRRRDHPFVVVNCAQLPPELIESELFGHDRGAFTGADARVPGAFERADGGTLFLDELGDLPPQAQAKILRSIESGEVTRLGGSKTQVDIRVVTATHRDLEAMIRDGSFREDLFYRLNVVEVMLPPLVERGDDILPLAEHFLSLYRRPDGSPVEGLTPSAVKRLVNYGWPGNVRELRNVIERAVVIDRDGMIDLDDLPENLTGPCDAAAAADAEPLSTEAGWKEARKRFEFRFFLDALERHGWKIKETADAIGVDRRTVSMKMREHGLEKPRGTPRRPADR